MGSDSVDHCTDRKTRTAKYLPRGGKLGNGKRLFDVGRSMLDESHNMARTDRSRVSVRVMNA